MNMTHRRRGVVLILALVAIGLLAGLLAVIGVGTGQQLHQRQTDRVRLAAIAIADSAAAYARRPDRLWPTTQPDATIELNVSALVPASMQGEAHLTIGTGDGQKACRVDASVTLGAYTAAETRHVKLSGS